MTYRTSAEPVRPIVVRRVPSGDPFRWLKLVFGFACLGGALLFAVIGTWTSVRCVEERCVVAQETILLPTREYPFDARLPPPIVLAPATVGKNGSGLRLALRYPSGDVEIARGWPSDMEAEAARIRGYFAAPHGTLTVGASPRPGPHAIVIVLALLGLGVLLDGLKVLLWHRLRADPRARTITLETVLLGAAVRRRAFAVTPSTKLASEPLRPGDERVRLRVLTLEDDGKSPVRLPIYERDATRPLVEEMIEAAS